ncbi:carbon-nitrogen hydrolase family protein [Archaeoglobus veneficus]|uniref:Nitrilase/cyanide hydratase and apolipoprotein N-acyltransferase n=1 Tax=Archaeoglobus veneficus (strain DSM 11195 / SNP6) TaxID=693661 RepID=F2KQ47_ARCVS|nr:carbon-nitrogen hydrolase family protein [Archaeoglobus veneficus]AEA47650.1 Nitrilase/cyanide hydratase and apolipoprotein N-acyltransferase [Archaeoglobus veneficus SNP6]
MRICIYQMKDRGSVEGNIRAACKTIPKVRADFLCLPEFFALPADYIKMPVERVYEKSKHTLDEIVRASREFSGYIIAGTVIERDDAFYNTCYVLRKGEIIAKYRKINITEEERLIGISPGEETVVFDTEFCRIGLLICADCLSSKVVKSVANRSDVVFLPISLTSPSHPKVEGHPVSERIAREYGVTVVKISRIGLFNGVKFGVKSAAIAPDGVVVEAGGAEEEIIYVDL